LDQALRCVDRASWDAGRIEDLRRTRRSGRAVRPGVDRLFAEVADAFFAAERLRPDPVSVLDPAFSIVVVIEGTGTLEAEHGDPVEVRAGDTLLIPYASGGCTLRGDTTAIRCRPPQGEVSPRG
jgi:mannose-6-phosphate isomerase